MPDRRARIHFIGVCGTAMATLAAMLKARGHDVQGSDHNMYPPMSDFLAAEGIRTFDGYQADRITAELDRVVVGNAISRGNAELEAVLTRRVRYLSLPEAIREAFLWDTCPIVLAGTHGKTTTTALTAWLLTSAGRDPSALIGGIASNFGRSYRLGAGPEFVIEGDEYDSAYFDKTAKFLKYRPEIAVIGNIEYDHADIYPDMASLRTAFRRLVTLVPQSGHVILGADSPEAAALAAASPAPVTTVGLGSGADWRARHLEQGDGRTRFTVTARGAVRGPFEMALLGEHNVRNALAALVVGALVGLSDAALREGLSSFVGVRRRLELRGEARGVSVYDDFAHHPTAIYETVRALRAARPGHRLWALFEPRSATSCRRVFQAEFARAFAESGADEIVLAPVFRSALPEAERLSVPTLVADLEAQGRHVRAPGSTAEIVRLVAAEAVAGDLVLVMSNGGFDGIHQQLLRALDPAR